MGEVRDGERQIRAIEGPRLPSAARKEEFQGCPEDRFESIGKAASRDKNLKKTTTILSPLLTQRTF